MISNWDETHVTRAKSRILGEGTRSMVKQVTSKGYVIQAISGATSQREVELDPIHLGLELLLGESVLQKMLLLNEY